MQWAQAEMQEIPLKHKKGSVLDRKAQFSKDSFVYQESM